MFPFRLECYALSLRSKYFWYILSRKKKSPSSSENYLCLTASPLYLSVALIKNKFEKLMRRLSITVIDFTSPLERICFSYAWGMILTIYEYFSSLNIFSKIIPSTIALDKNGSMGILMRS